MPYLCHLAVREKPADVAFSSLSSTFATTYVPRPGKNVHRNTKVDYGWRSVQAQLADSRELTEKVSKTFLRGIERCVELICAVQQGALTMLGAVLC